MFITVFTTARHWSPILSQMNPVHTFPPCFPKIHSNIILPSKLSSSEWSLPFKFSIKILYVLLIAPMRATRPAHLARLDFITVIIFVEAYKL